MFVMSGAASEGCVVLQETLDYDHGPRKYTLNISVTVSAWAVVWCGVVWCGVVWCGVVWCGVVWCGVVWCGVVWCGVVW